MSNEVMKLTIVKNYLYGIALQLNLDPDNYQSYDLLVDGIGHSIHELNARTSLKESTCHDNCMGKQMCVQLIEQAKEKTRQDAIEYFGCYLIDNCEQYFSGGEDEIRQHCIKAYEDILNAGKIEETYPCSECGKPRTKAEDGTTFTVCDKCWDKAWDKVNTGEGE